MPHQLPDEIKQMVTDTIPPMYKMWWIRGVVLNAGVVDQGMPGESRINTKVQFGDVDAPGEGYDIVLEGRGFTFGEGDLIGVFGHEPKEASTVSDPRFLIHYNTGTYARAYPGGVNSPQFAIGFGKYKNWLACPVPTDSSKKLKVLAKKAMWPGIVLLLFSGGSIQNILMVLAIIASVIAMAFMYLGLPFLIAKKAAAKLNQPAFTRGTAAEPKPNAIEKFKESLNYDYVDITGTYEDVGIATHRWVRANPEPENGFVVIPRGQGTQGEIKEKATSTGIIPD